jgi:hypothetical protein
MLTVGLSVGALTIVIAGAAEIWLRVQRSGDSVGSNGDPYGAFRVQHLHPQYMYFFPFEPEARVALSNDVVRLSAEGFRGGAPPDAGDRRLAFVLGGSAVFGDFASSDSTTITAYLNQLQDEYFFVNAGVPSWITTQEMFRLAYDLLRYAPDLVVAYNGFNDVAVLRDHAELGGGLLTVGAPENFLQLRSVIDDIEADPNVPRYQLFPELRRRLGRGDVNVAWTDPDVVSEEVLQATVSQYLNNVERMHDLTVAAGARFVTVFQPIAGLHEGVPTEFASWTRESDATTRFHRAVVAERSSKLEFYDLSAMFDSLYEQIPVARNYVTDDETIFVDIVHLTDRGNRLAAERLAELLFPAERRSMP